MSKYEKRKVFLEFKIENMYENVQPQEPEEELNLGRGMSNPKTYLPD
jgi:hypothetical protein